MRTRLITILLLCVGSVTLASGQDSTSGWSNFDHPSPETLLGTESVLIIQDSLPWGRDSIQTVLTAVGIAYDQVDSTQMGVIDLAPYKMVVVPSVQGETYVGRWNSNIAWAEHFVERGGRLWLSATTQLGATNPLIPGGVIGSYDQNSYNDIADTTHPWVQGVPNPMYGTSASHNSFTNLYPRSQVVATAQSSGNPVLVDYRFGAGRVLITGQTLEFAWSSSWDGAPILENSLVDMYESFMAPDVLVIQDSLPWAKDSIHQVLSLHGIAYDQVDSIQMGVVDLAPYKMVVVPSVQGDTYVGRWNSNIAWAEHFVERGGHLWLSATTQGGTDPLIPGGVIGTYGFESYNDITDITHPWVQGVPNPMFGTGASHNSFTNLYPGSQVVATAQTSGNPVLVDYHFGAGRVLITGQALEWAWANAQDGAPILENSLVNMYVTFVAPAVLVILDTLPWGYDSIHQVLSLNGIAYEQTDSTQMGVVDLAPYKMVVVPSVQGDTYVGRWNSNIGWISQYVVDGGRLWLSATTQLGATNPLIPGGVIGAYDQDLYNDIADTTHPWVQGVPNPISGTSASHNSFTNLYPGSQVVATAQTSGNPVLVDYRFGAGRILITGQALEWAWANAQDGAPILENSTLDMFSNIFADDLESGDTSAWSGTVE